MSKSKDKKGKENGKPPSTTKPKFITDPKLISELDKKSLYICPSETKRTLDDDLLENNKLKKSCEKVGPLDRVLVAVWFDDPNRDSETSEERVHMRIIEGRHRYLQDENWPRNYIDVGSTKQFWDYQRYFGVRKKDNPEERKAKIIMMGNFLRNHGTPLHKIAAELCRWLEDTHWPQEILDYVPQEWKDPTKAENRRKKTKLKNHDDIVQKPTQELENLQIQNQRLEEELKNKNTTILELQNEKASYLEENLGLKNRLLLEEDLRRKDSSRIRILENAEQEVDVEGVGKIKIKLERDGTTYTASKAT